MITTFKSFEEILHNIRCCEIVDCCTSKQKLYHCLFCPTSNFKPARLAKVKTHIIVHWRAELKMAKVSLIYVAFV